MIRYRNIRHGVVVERHAPDEWLEASAGWERDPLTSVGDDAADDNRTPHDPEPDGPVVDDERTD